MSALPFATGDEDKTTSDLVASPVVKHIAAAALCETATSEVLSIAMSKPVAVMASSR